VEVSLIKSSGGAFEVTVDGTVVFSKRTSGRHATPGEVVKRIREGGG
jgi:selT/selW/selH-like putative selenoprotein